MGAALAEAGINIDDVRNPHDSRGINSLAIMKVNKAVPAGVFRAISEKIEALSSFQIELTPPDRR